MKDDTISRQAAIEHLKKRLYETEFNSTAEYPYYKEIADNRVDVWMSEVPSTQPEIIRCKDCMWYNDGYCPNVDGIRKSDFYCADSERRTDG